MENTASAGPPISEARLFALEAFEHVDKNKIEEYEKLGKLVDNQVEESEPGMLVHALTKVSETEAEVVYRWLEVFESPEALQTHLDNPLVREHIKKMEGGILCGPSKIVIYADWDDDQKDYWRKIYAGINLVFAPLVTGFFVKR